MQVARAAANESTGAGGPPPDRLRRVRIIIAAVVVVGAGVLAATYFLQPPAAKLKVPRLSLRVRQTVHGFVLTRSEGGRTMFRLQAQVATQMERAQHTILQQVALTVFDPDGIHADRISGERFQYDPEDGNVVAAGEVHIALEGRRPLEGGARGNKRSASPIDVIARILRFNTKTGAAVASGGLQFRYWNATGQAEEAQLGAGSNRLVLNGDVRLRWAPPGRWPLNIRAGRAVLDKVARTITLLAPAGGRALAPAALDPVVTMGPRRLTAPKLIFHLGPNDAVQWAAAEGGVKAETTAPRRALTLACQTAQMRFQPTRRGGAARGPLRQPGVRVAQLTLSGNVQAQMRQADGGRQRLKAATVRIAFTGQNVPTGGEATQATIWTWGGSRRGDPALPGGTALRRPDGQMKARVAAGGEAELTAPLILFTFGPGAKPGQTALRQAWTEGRGTARYLPAGNQGAMDVSANRFALELTAAGRPATARATGEVAWSQAAAANQAARNGTAGAVEAWMDPETGHAARLVESGGVRMVVAGGGLLETPARVGSARRGAAGQARTAVPLAGGPTVVEGETLRWEAASGVAQLTPPPGGRVVAAGPGERLTAAELILTPVSVLATGGIQARITGRGPGMLGAGGALPGAATHGGAGRKDGNPPVNITAQELAASRDGQRGIFSGDVRVWQGASTMRAAALAFDRARGTATASGSGAAGVRSSFVASRGGRMAAGQTQLLPARMGAGQAAARAKKTGAKPAPPEPVAVQVEAPVFHYWQQRGLAEYSGGVSVLAAATRLSCRYLRIEWKGATRRPSRMVAGGGVEVAQPGRRAQGQRAIYDPQRRTVTLEGGSPSIYDAELGLLAGSALTFSPVNATIRVESGPGTRTFAAYRVSH